MARTLAALGLFFATSIGFASPAPAQYNVQYNPQYNNPQYNPESQYNSPRTYQGYQGNQGIRAANQAGTKATKGIRAANQAGTKATKGIRAAIQAVTKATRPDARMVSNSIPDRTVALRRRPRCRHARQGSNSIRARTAAFTRCRAE
jgi:hypothetical protein